MAKLAKMGVQKREKKFAEKAATTTQTKNNIHKGKTVK